MNYKSISLAVLATLALTSCKKDIEVKEEFKGQENVTEQTVAPTSTEESKTIQPKAIDPNAKYGKMEFESLDHDFGTINGTDQVETVFTFTNTGDTDLVISKAHGSCGCTVPEYPKQPIAPGAKGEIKVSFSPKGKNGMQNKTVTLNANTQTGVETLHIKANIVK